MSAWGGEIVSYGTVDADTDVAVGAYCDPYRYWSISGALVGTG